MEQDDRLYEYKMGSEVFRFEARSHSEAELMRGGALQYFAERLGTLFSEEALTGPEVAEMPPGFRYVAGAREMPVAYENPFPGP